MEERSSTLHTGEHEDFCSRCGVGGKLVCCDFCPKVYHLGCLEPRLNDIPPDVWACPSCASRMYLTKNDLKTVILSRRVSQVLRKNYKQSGLEAVQSMLRVMQAASVLQRDDIAPGQYAREMRQDMFGDMVHESLRGVYRYSSMWCAILRVGPFLRFLGMYDEAETAYEAFERARKYFEPVMDELSSVDDRPEKLRLERRPSTVAVISSKFKLVLGDSSHKNGGDFKRSPPPLLASSAGAPYSDGLPLPTPTVFRPFTQQPQPQRQPSSGLQAPTFGQRYLPPFETPQTPVSLEALPPPIATRFPAQVGVMTNGDATHATAAAATTPHFHMGQPAVGFTQPQLSGYRGQQQQLPTAAQPLQPMYHPVHPQAQFQQPQYPHQHQPQHHNHVAQPQPYQPYQPFQSFQPFQPFQPQLQPQPQHYPFHPGQARNGYPLPAIPQTQVQIPSPPQSSPHMFTPQPPVSYLQQLEEPLPPPQPLPSPPHLPLPQPFAQGRGQQPTPGAYQPQPSPQPSPVYQSGIPPQSSRGVFGVPGNAGAVPAHSPQLQQLPQQQQPGLPPLAPMAGAQSGNGFSHSHEVSALPLEEDDDAADDFDFDENVSFSSISELDEAIPDTYEAALALVGDSQFGADADCKSDGAYEPQDIAGDMGGVTAMPPLPVYDNSSSVIQDQATSSSVSPQSSSTSHTPIAQQSSADSSAPSVPQPQHHQPTQQHNHQQLQHHHPQQPRQLKKTRRRKGEPAPVRKRVKTIVAGPGAWGVKLERDISDGDTDTLTRAERRKRQLRGFYSPPAVGTDYQAEIPEWVGPKTEGKEEDKENEQKASASHDDLYVPAEPEPETVSCPIDGMHLSDEELLQAREAFILYEDDLVSARHALKWPMKQIVKFYYRVWQLSPLGYVMQQLRNQRSIELLIKRGSSFSTLYGVRSSKRSK